MEREKIVYLTGSILIFFLLLFIYSKFGPSLPISVLTQTKGDPMMITGVGKVTVVPDIAKITAGVEKSGTNLKQVQNEVNSISKTITDELKKLKIDEKNIKTISYNIYPEYDYNTPTRGVTGYRISTSYEIKITDFEKVNDALVVVTNAGANLVGGINLEVNEETKKQKLQEAREIAAKDAKEKAGSLAKASGITLGKIVNVSEGGGVDYPRPIYLEKTLDVGSEPAVDANIQPGESEFEVTITLFYEVR